MIMTYKMFLQVEEYISEINNLIKNSKTCPEATLKEKAETLNSKIKSSIKEYRPEGISWDDAKQYCSDGLGGNVFAGYDVNKINNILDIMLVTLQAILNSLPCYDEICDLRKDISYGENISKNKKLKRNFIVEKIEKYSHSIKFDQSVIIARDGILSGSELREEQLDSTFRIVLSNMENYMRSLFANKRDSIEMETSRAQNIINVTANGGNAMSYSIAEATAKVDMSINIEQTIEQVKDACLNPEEEAAILAKLEEIKKIAQERNKKTRWEKVKGVFKWLAEQSLQAAAWIIPLVFQLIQNT